MQTKRYKPLIDKLFGLIAIPMSVFLIAVTIIPSLFDPSILFIMLPTDILFAYFLISPLCGYVELRKRSLFIKYGFFLKKEIPYEKIRGTKKERKWYSDSMMALKNSMEHVNVLYNIFDVTSLSVIENDAFIKELAHRCHPTQN